MAYGYPLADVICAAVSPFLSSFRSEAFETTFRPPEASLSLPNLDKVKNGSKKSYTKGDKRQSLAVTHPATDQLM